MFTFADQERTTRLTMEEERKDEKKQTAKRKLKRGKMTLQEIAEYTRLKLCEVEELAGMAMA